MKLTGVFIPFIPFLWLVCSFISTGMQNIVVYLAVVELFSGIIWAGFNLAAGNFIYDAVSRQKLAICVAYFNVLNGIGILIGASLGGYISSINFTFFGLSPIAFVFILSGIIRIIIYFTMNKKIQEVREVKRFKIKKVVRRELEPLRKIIENFNYQGLIPFKLRPI